MDVFGGIGRKDQRSINKTEQETVWEELIARCRWISGYGRRKFWQKSEIERAIKEVDKNRLFAYSIYRFAFMIELITGRGNDRKEYMS